MAAACEKLGSNLAVDVLPYETVKKLGLILSSNNTLTNWKDVAGKLGKSVEEIEGYYALRTGAADPGYSVLTDWIRGERGTISQLCYVFEDLNLQSCLDEMKEDIQKFATKKQTERIAHDPDSLDERHRKPSNLNKNSPAGSWSCAPSESRAHSSSEIETMKPTSQCSDDVLRNTCTLEKNDTNDGMRAELTENCNIPSTSETSGVPCAAEESATRESNSKLVSSRSFFRYVSCPPDVGLPSPPPSPTPTGRRGFRGRLPRRSKSVRCQRDSTNIGMKFWRFLNKRTSSENGTKTGQLVTSDRTNCTQATSAAHTHMEPAEKQVSNLSPVTNPSADCLTAFESSSTAHVSSSGQTCRPDSRPDTTSFPVSSGETKDPGNEVGRDSAGLEDSQERHTSRPERESGYSSEESECPPSPLAVDSSKKIFIINHEDNRQAAESLHNFFKEQDCECHLYQLEYSLVAASMPFKYMATNLENADFVLVCPSPKLSEVLNMVEDKRGSLHGYADQMDQSLRYALDLMVGEMGCWGRNLKGKYMPVLFDQTDLKYVPFSLQGAMRYAWPRDCNRMITVMNGEQRLL